MYYSTTRGDTSRRTLHDDDKAGIAFLYPKGGAIGNGDIDRSGRVDGWDLFLLGISFGSRSGQAAYNKDSDINNDGWVDGQDLAILSGNFGNRV